jgi:enhancer of polycomb-like protein
MTTEDDAFLKAFNQKRSGQKCSEDDFERIMEAFEDTAAEQAPFASIDNTVIPFETMQLALKQQVLPKVQVFAKDIYEHWKVRRQESGNTPLQPSLKFEKNQELDDGDPYVCFRRRDARQTRKTRNRDVQSTEKLKRLRKELEEGRQLIGMAYQRELTKKDLLKVDKDIFEQRVKVKETKIKLGIKTDDEDLINQRVCDISTDIWVVLTLCSRRRGNSANFPNFNVRLEPSCACLGVQMAAHLMLI